MKKIALGMMGLALMLTGCASASTGPDMVAVHYSGGATSAKKFKDCLPPSDRSGFHPGDKYYGYPTRQVSYDATGGAGSEAEPFGVVSKDNAQMKVPVTITFTLKTDCTTLRKMHETIGGRYDAAFDASGSTSDENEGWTNMLNYVIGKPLDTSLDRMAQQYNWRDLWNNPQVKSELEKQVNESIADLVKRQAGGDFFEGYSVLLMKPEPNDPGLTDAINREQSEVAQSNAEKARAEADTAKAEAQIKLAQAEALKKKAEIQGYGGFDNYICVYMADQGLNCKQPTYIWGGKQQ